MPDAAIEDRPTSRGWYLVAFGLIGTALAIAITGFMQMKEVVVTMQRRVMPGKAEIALAPGKSTLYFEQRSVIDEVEYVNDSPVQFTCSVRDATGKPLTLEKPIANVTYSVGGFKGHNVYDMQIAAPGIYTLECSGPTKFVLSLGGGIGAWLVVALVGGLMPGLAGLIVVVVVTLKRRRWFKRHPGATSDS
jgi:hypothetical protein